MATLLASIATATALELFRESQAYMRDPLSTLTFGDAINRNVAVDATDAGVISRDGVKETYVGYITKRSRSVGSALSTLCTNNGNSSSPSNEQFKADIYTMEAYKEICIAEYRSFFAERGADEKLATILYNYQLSGRGSVVALMTSIHLELMMGRFKEEMIYVRLFGNKAYGVDSNVALVANTNANAVIPADASKFITNNLSKYDGLFAQLAASVVANTTPFVDANSGVTGNTAIDPANVRRYLAELQNKMSPILRQRAQTSVGAVVAFLDPAIIQAYQDYLINTYINIPESYYLLTEMFGGQRILLYNGIPLIPLMPSYLLDSELGAMKTTTISTAQDIYHSRNLRGFVTMMDNIITVTDGAGVGGDVPLFTLKESQDNRARGVIIAQGFARFGVGLVEPEHFVATWASNTTSFI